jgi:hypothetical protein
LKTATLQPLCLIVVSLVLTALASGQKSTMPPTAPVPPQLTAAQKIFISNAGGESFETVFDQVVFNGGPDRPYNQFYAAMKDWGQRQLVSSPSEADLALEISWILTDTGLGRLPVLGQLHLVIVDPRTHVTLWAITEYVRGAVLLSNRDRNFDHAMNVIVDRLQTLMIPAPSTSH